MEVSTGGIILPPLLMNRAEALWAIAGEHGPEYLVSPVMLEILHREGYLIDSIIMDEAEDILLERRQ